MNNLKVDSSVPRQATFETEPADTVKGRNVKRGGMNIPYIDDKSVKKGKNETTKDIETLKKEQLKALKDKELEEEKKRNLKAEKELKSMMEREIKVQKEKLLKEKEREQKLQREKELKALKERENKAERERDLQLQKEKVQKAKQERDARVAREKEQKLQKEKELKNLKEKEIRIQKEKEAKALQEKETKLRKENEEKVRKEIEESAKRQKEALLREKELKSKIENDKSLDKTEKPGAESKPSILQRLGRSLSPKKKEKQPPSQTKSSNDKADTDSNAPTPSITVEDEFNSKQVKTSPASRLQDVDSPRYVPQSSRDSLILSPDNETPAMKSSDISTKNDAWISERRRSSTPDVDQRSKVLRKFNSDSPTRTDSDLDEPKRSRRAKYLKSSTYREGVGSSDDVNGKPTTNDVDEEKSHGTESYDEILAERDCLLTSETIYKKKIKQLQDEVGQLLELTEKLDLENKELRWNMENPTAVNEATTLTKKLQERIEALEEEVNELQRDKKKYMILHNDSERKVTEIEQENDILKEKMLLYEKDKLPQLEELQAENKKLESSVKNLKAKNKEIDEHFEIVKNENSEISDELRIKRNEVQELLENLKHQKTVELELQKEIARLEARIKKFEEMEGELATQVAKAAVQDAEKEQLQDLIKEKEKEIKEIKDVIDSKNTDIDNQKLANELKTEEVEKLKSEMEKQKQNADKIQSLEKEIESLKKTIKTLQDQLEESQKKNKNLQSEVDGSKKKMVRIKEDYDEVSKHQSILEAEKKAKVSLEQQLTVSKDEVSSLQQQNMELNIKISNLNERLKSLEQDKEQNEGVSKKKNMADKLESENRRLRYRLVEKNFAEVAGQSEKAALSSRLEHLEQKQVDNEVKVKQLQGWVDDIYTETSSPRRSPAALPVAPTQDIPRVAVATQSEKTANKAGKSKRQRAQSPKEVRPRKQENTRLAVSLDDMRSGRDDSRCSTPTLPLIKDIPEQAPIYNSYFYIYKQKQKMMRQQQKIR